MQHKNEWLKWLNQVESISVVQPIKDSSEEDIDLDAIVENEPRNIMQNGDQQKKSMLEVVRSTNIR